MDHSLFSQSDNHVDDGRKEMIAVLVLVTGWKHSAFEDMADLEIATEYELRVLKGDL